MQETKRDFSREVESQKLNTLSAGDAARIYRQMGKVESAIRQQAVYIREKDALRQLLKEWYEYELSRIDADFK